MKSLSGLYFHLEIKDNDLVFSLVRQSLAHIEQLETTGIHVKYMQLRANEVPGLCFNKEIWIKIDSDKGTYIASDASVEWTQAFANTLKAVEEKMLHREVDYVKPARLFGMELYLPQGSSLSL